MNESQKRILLHAINHFGVEANVNKALEEMWELTTELSRRRLERFDRDKVAEEIADVLITVEKLRIIYGGAKVDRIVEKKLTALEGNMLRPSGDDSSTAQFCAALEKFALTTAGIIPHSEDAKLQERMMPKGMVEHRPVSEVVGPALLVAMLDSDKTRIPCCAKCGHLRHEVIDEFPMPFCPFYGILGGDIKKICCTEYQKKEGAKDE